MRLGVYIVTIAMSSYFRAYSNLLQVRMDEIQPKRNEYDQYFTRNDQREIDEIIDISLKNLFTPIETLLKHIHKRYSDPGLQLTLVHRLFSSTDSEISYYVPELVYIAIKKPCKAMKKLLIQRAKQNESLRRLILWNVKAFTVLMKKDLDVKREIQAFEEELIKHVKNMTKFNHSLKAIAMLTQASLILKKMPSAELKEKLLKFIRRYNTQILNNLQHSIIIPFRQESPDSKEKHYNSNYVVHIVEDDCSCFPTRKRVPYRIIIQTIDLQELQDQHPDEKFNLVQKVEPDQERDLYNEVAESVDNLFTHFRLDLDNIFAKDNQENKRISQLKNFFSNLEKEEIKEQHDTLARSKLKLKSSALSRGGNQDSLAKYRIKPSESLKTFDAIYIAGKTPNYRRSEMSFNELNSLQYPKEQPQLRRSAIKGTANSKETNQIETYIQGEFKDCNLMIESIWGQAWELKKLKYGMKSNFSRFKSLRFRNVVVKGGDDLRQEIICMQLIYKMRDIIRQAGVEAFIKPYEIIVLSENSGILQFVSNSISVDEMKKKSEGISISKFFQDVFQDNVEKAKECFIKSLVGSSILTYVLKLKDRHNGNILLDMEGNIIHIDFGFILGMAPGNLNFQSSPFKFTEEYLDLMGGQNSQNYLRFTELFCQGMLALRKRVDELTLILEIMMEESDLDCFKDFRIQDFKNSFKLHYAVDKYREYCHTLVERSCKNSRTGHYDTFQWYTNGIMP